MFADVAADPSQYVLAMHDYAPQTQNATCLSFRAGQVIHVLNRDPSGWWDGELEGRRGWFPSNYVNAEVNLTVEEEDTIPVVRLSISFVERLNLIRPTARPRP